MSKPEKKVSKKKKVSKISKKKKASKSKEQKQASEEHLKELEDQFSSLGLPQEDSSNESKIIKSERKLEAFVLKQNSDSKREMLNPDRALELIQPLKEVIQKKDFDFYYKITLSGHSFSQEAAEAIAPYLKQLKGLCEIDYSDFMSGRSRPEALKVVETLCSSLNEHTIKMFNLSDNAIGQGGIEASAAVLQKQSKLEHLYLNNAGLDANASLLIRKYLLENNYSDQKSLLKTFEMHNNMQGDSGAINIAPLIKASRQLESLRYSTTRVRDTGMAHIVDALVGLKTLTHLDLSDNRIGLKSATQLSEIIKSQNSLKKLLLLDTDLKEEGLIAVLTALSNTAPDLEVLDLGGLSITSELATKYLAPMIQKKDKLRVLLLEGNELGSGESMELFEWRRLTLNRLEKTILDTITTLPLTLIQIIVEYNPIFFGVPAILNALQSNNILEHFSLATNGIEGNVRKEIELFLKEKTNLKKFDLNGNRLSSDDIQLIRRTREELGYGVSSDGTWSDNESDDFEEE